MTKLLTGNMIKVLAKLDEVEWRSPYDLQASIGTLDALVKRRLAKVHHGLGSIYSPRTSIKYRLTEAGREAVTAALMIR